MGSCWCLNSSNGVQSDKHCFDIAHHIGLELVIMAIYIHQSKQLLALKRLNKLCELQGRQAKIREFFKWGWSGISFQNRTKLDLEMYSVLAPQYREQHRKIAELEKLQH